MTTVTFSLLLLLWASVAHSQLPYKLPGAFELLGDGTLTDVTNYYRGAPCTCTWHLAYNNGDCLSSTPIVFSAFAGECTTTPAQLRSQGFPAVIVSQDGSFITYNDCSARKAKTPRQISETTCRLVRSYYYAQMSCTCGSRDPSTEVAFSLFELRDGASCNMSLQVTGRSSELDYQVVHTVQPTSPIPFSGAVGFVPNTQNCTQITSVPSWCMSSWYKYLPYSSGTPGHLSGSPSCKGKDTVYYRLLQWSTGSNVQLCVNNKTGYPTWFSYTPITVDERKWVVSFFFRNVIVNPYIPPGTFDAPTCKQAPPPPMRPL